MPASGHSEERNGFAFRNTWRATGRPTLTAVSKFPLSMPQSLPWPKHRSITVMSEPGNNELRVFASLADAKTLLNERVWRTEINATVNESGYGTDYALMEKAVSRLPWRSMAYTVAETPHMPVRVAVAPERDRARRCERSGGHCASGRGRPQEEGNRDARAGGGRGAKGTKDGRVGPPLLSLPRRETQGKNFFEVRPASKNRF